MKHLDFLFPLVVVLVFCTLPFEFLGFMYVVYSRDVLFGVFLEVLGVVLPVFVGIMLYKFK